MPERTTTAPVAVERAILRVTRPALLWQSVGGMRVLERQLFTASRAGVNKLWIAAPWPQRDLSGDLRLPPGLDVRWMGTEGSFLPECKPPYLGLSADHFIRVDALARIARERSSESIAFDDASDLEAVSVVLGDAPRGRRPLPEGACRRLGMPPTDDQTISWLMAAGSKTQDGFMARHFDRRISLAISRRLLETPLTPNQMTLFSTLLGLIGTAFFLGASRAAYVSGALLVWLHSVLDGCDGELARVRFQESAFGSDLDFWGDNLVHLALFSCLGYGFWRTGNGVHTLVLAAVADLGVLASAAAAWRHRLRRRAGSPTPIAEAGVTEEAAGGGFRSKLSHLENALAQRDFIYLLVLLALTDCVYEFLWAAAVGGLLYFGIMLYLRSVNDNDQKRQPHLSR